LDRCSDIRGTCTQLHDSCYLTISPGGGLGQAVAERDPPKRLGSAGAGVGEPGGALVVEVGEGALREVDGVEAGRIEPAVAELDEAAGSLPYSLALLGRMDIS